MAVENNSNSSEGKKAERFLRLITPVQGKIYGYILSRWPNKTDADDIMQETIATIWNRFNEYQPGTDFHVWAILTAKYAILNFRRKNIKNPIHFDDDVWGILQDKSDEFFKRYDDRVNMLKDCIEKLDKNDKNLLDLKYLHELSVKRIAERFDISTRAAYKTLSRIYGILMRCIRRSFSEGAL